MIDLHYFNILLNMYLRYVHLDLFYKRKLIYSQNNMCIQYVKSSLFFTFNAVFWGQADCVEGCKSLQELKWLLTETTEIAANNHKHRFVVQLILFINSMKALLNRVIVWFILVTIRVRGGKVCIYHNPRLTVKK